MSSANEEFHCLGQMCDIQVLLDYIIDEEAQCSVFPLSSQIHFQRHSISFVYVWKLYEKFAVTPIDFSI